MTWRYGILKTKMANGEYYYAIHEFYDGVPEMEKDKDTGLSWTEDEIAASGDSPEEVIEVLEMMLKDAKSSPVQEDTEEPKKADTGILEHGEGMEAWEKP